LHLATYSLFPGLWMDFHHLDGWHASHTRSFLCIPLRFILHKNALRKICRWAWR